MCRSLLPVLFWSASVQAAVTNVRFVGSTPTQAVIAYTAPDSSACTIEVSESESYAPPVHDVNPALFPGANLDSRAGNIGSGQARTFVIGKRAAELASDGKYYSRALQAFTPHYWRLTCGADTATGTFSTTNPALGATYSDPLPRDSAHPGRYAWPTIDYTYPTTPGNGTLTSSGTTVTFKRAESIATNDYIVLTSGPNAGQQRRVAGVSDSKHVVLAQPFRRDQGAGTSWAKRTPEKTSTQKIIDPQTGLLIRRVSNAGVLDGPSTVALTTVTPGAGWNNASTQSLAAVDSDVASYTGDAGRSWLFVHAPSGYANYNEGYNQMDWVTVTLQGSGTGSGDDDAIDMCLTADGATCRSAILTVNLNTCVPWSKVDSQCWVGTEIPLEAAWQSPTDAIGSILDPVEMNAPTGGILIRKTTPTPNTVSLDYLAVNIGRSVPGEEHSYAAQICSSALAPQTYNGTTRQGYRCVFGNVEGLGYWIDSASGDAVLSAVYQAADSRRFAGPLGANFDNTDATKLYGMQLIDGSEQIVRTDYTGKNLDSGFAPWGVSFSDTGTVTALSGNLATGMAAFSPDYAAHQAYWNSVDVAGMVDNRYLHVDFSASGNQDFPAYKGIYDLQTNRFIAATSTLSYYPSRWCRMHNQGNGATSFGWAELSSAYLYNGPECGNGPFQTELGEALGMPGGDTGRDVACPSPMPVQSSARTTAGGTNLCASVLVSGDFYKPATTCAYENTLRGAGGFLGAIQAARPGDIVGIDSERVQLLSKDPACSDPNAACRWTVLRGVDGTAPAAHNSGAPGYGLCAAYSLNGNDLQWDFLHDPNGADETMTYKKFLPNTHGAGPAGPDLAHLITVLVMYTNCGMGSAAWGCYAVLTGGVPDISAQALSGAFPHSINFSPAFANLAGQTGDSHPSLLQASDFRWLLDGRPYYPPPQAWAQVSGTLYKSTAALNPKILATEAFCASKPAVDVSPGPIAASAEDAYKFCYGASCYPGAGSNDIYMNCPDATTLSCLANQDTGDMCVHDLSPTSPVYAQIGISPAKDQSGAFTRFLGKPFGRRRDDLYKHMDESPDGKWGFFLARWLDGMRMENMALKLPPWPAKDSINRGTFIPMAVPVGSVPSGTDSVIAEFGYDTNFYCTTRREACQAATGTVNESAPFYWAGETPGGLRGAPGTIAIPGISERVLYYRLKYLDAARAVIGTGPTEVRVVP